MKKLENPFLKDPVLAKNTSLNRLKVIDIPGYNIDLEVKGKLGSEIMSHDVLVDYIKRESDFLKLDLDKIKETELPIYLNKFLESTDLKVRLTAENIARRIGRNLGYILLVLKRGDEVNQNARDIWDQRCWNYWNKVENIIFTGGLCNGNLGKRFEYYIDKVFNETDTPSYQIKIAQEPSLVSMIGAARHISRECNSSLIFDFGQTLIKRGVANYRDEELEEIHQLPSMNSKYVELEDKSQPKKQRIEEAERLKNHMITVIVKTWKEVRKKGFEPCKTIAISIGNNIVDGKLGGGGYEKLNLLTDNHKEFLSKKVSSFIDEDIDLEFIHDGTAAADAFSGAKNSVMITLGTAIGVGFPLEKNNLRPVSKDIKFIK